MKLNASNVNKVKFAKKFIATANVVKVSNGKEKPIPCSIYKLERGIDKDYFKTQPKYWKKAAFADSIEAELLTKSSQSRPFGDIYTIEDSKGKMLGYCEQDELYFQNVLALVETSPAYKNAKKDRKIKYVGETMLAFLVKMAKNQNKAAFAVDSVLDEARDFYSKKCGFEKDGIRTYILSEKQFDNFISQNESHTQGKIEFMG